MAWMHRERGSTRPNHKTIKMLQIRNAIISQSTTWTILIFIWETIYGICERWEVIGGHDVRGVSVIIVDRFSCILWIWMNNIDDWVCLVQIKANHVSLYVCAYLCTVRRQQIVEIYHVEKLSKMNNSRKNKYTKSSNRNPYKFCLCWCHNDRWQIITKHFKSRKNVLHTHTYLYCIPATTIECYESRKKLKTMRWRQTCFVIGPVWIHSN